MTEYFVCNIILFSADWKYIIIIIIILTAKPITALATEFEASKWSNKICKGMGEGRGGGLFIGMHFANRSWELRSGNKIYITLYPENIISYGLLMLMFFMVLKSILPGKFFVTNIADVSCPIMNTFFMSS